MNFRKGQGRPPSLPPLVKRLKRDVLKLLLSKISSFLSNASFLFAGSIGMSLFLTFWRTLYQKLNELQYVKENNQLNDSPPAPTYLVIVAPFWIKQCNNATTRTLLIFTLTWSIYYVFFVCLSFLFLLLFCHGFLIIISDHFLDSFFTPINYKLFYCFSDQRNSKIDLPVNYQRCCT